VRKGKHGTTGESSREKTGKNEKNVGVLPRVNRKDTIYFGADTKDGEETGTQ